MSNEIELIIDPETGEILEIPTGPERLGFVVRKLHDAQTQEKAWSQFAAALKAIVLREQQEQKAVYDDLQVSIVQAIRKTQDLDAIRQFIDTTELTRDDLKELALAATGFDVERLSDHLADAINDMTREVPNKPYPRISAVRRRAVTA